MKLHLPKRLFTALLTAITLAAAPAALTLGSAAWGEEEVSTPAEGFVVDYSVFDGYAYTIYQWTGTNGIISRGYWYEMEYNSDEGELTFQYDDSGNKISSGTSGQTNGYESYIVSDKTLVFDANSTKNTSAQLGNVTDLYGAGTTYVYDCQPMKISGVVVKNEEGVAGSLLGNNTDGNKRELYIGGLQTNAETGKIETSYSVIEKNFTIDTTNSNVTLQGVQVWQVASDATYTFKTCNSTTRIITLNGDLTLQGGTVDFQSALKMTNAAVLTVEKGAKLTATEIKSDGAANTNRKIYVAKGASIEANNLAISWNMNSVDVDGLLNVNTEVYLGSNDDSNTVRLLTGEGTIQTAKLRAGNHGSYGINVATLNIGDSGLLVENQAVLNLASTTTTVSGTTTVNSGNVLNFNSGSATLTGEVSNSGNININGGVVAMNGGMRGAGSLSIAEGAELTIAAGSTMELAHTITGTGTLTLNGNLHITDYTQLNGYAASYSDGASGFFNSWTAQLMEGTLIQGDGASITVSGMGAGSILNFDDDTGYLAATLAPDGVYYVNDNRDYSAASMGTASSLNISSTGTLSIGLSDVGTKPISNSGKLNIAAGTGNVTLNTLLSADNAITQTATGITSITTTGTVSTDGAIAHTTGTLKIQGESGTSKATLSSTHGWTVGSLELENITATLQKSGDQQLKLTNLTLNAGATLNITGGSDFASYSADTYTWTVNEGAVLWIGTTTTAARQTLGRNFRLVLAGGVVNGKSDGSNGALDYYNNNQNNSETAGTIQVTKSSTLNAAVRARGGVVNFQIDGSDTVLTMGSPGADVTNYAAFTGGGSFKISGEGTLLYKGAEFTHALAISAGVFEYNTGDTRTHTGAITGAGTFKKSGSGTLTLSNATVASLNVAAGKLIYQLADNAEAEVDHTLALVLDSSASFEKTGEGTLNVGALHEAQFGAGIVVSQGVLQYNGDTGEKYGNPPKFVYLLRDVATTGTGKVQVVGDVKFNWNVDATSARTETVSSKVNVTGNLEINTWSTPADVDGDSMTRWEVVDNGLLEVGGKLWMTNNQKLVVNGGAVDAGSVYLGHSQNSEGTNRYSKVVIADGSLTTGHIAFVGKGNAVSMTGGVLTFTPETENKQVLVDGGHSGAGTISISGGTLAATTTDWTMTGTSSHQISLGNVTFDVAAGKTVTLAGSYDLTGSLSLIGNTVVENESTSTGALTLTGTMNITSLQNLKHAEGQYAEGIADSNGFNLYYYYLVENTDGASISTTGLSVTLSGAAVNVLQSSTGNHLLIYDGSQAGVYHVNTGTVSATNEIMGTEGFERYHVAKNASLAIDTSDAFSEDNRNSVLTSTTGSGSLVLSASASFGGLATVFQGDIRVTNGATLTLGALSDNQASVAATTNVSSLSGIVLDGGNLKYQGSTGSIQSITALSDADFTIFDMTATNSVADTLSVGKVIVADGTTLTVNGADGGSYKHHLSIGQLSGAGDLTVYGAGNSYWTERQASFLTISSLEDFTGNISITSREKTHDSAQVDFYHAIVNTGVSGAVLKSLQFAGFGEQGKNSTAVFNVQGDTQVDTLVATGVAVNLDAGTTLTLGAGTIDAQKQHSIGTLSAASAGVTLGNYATLSLGDGTHSIGTFSGGDGSKLDLAANAVLDTITITPDSGVTLTGSGTYKLASNTTTMTTGLTLGTGWTGTVVMHGVTGDKNQLKTILEGLTNGTSSKVQLSGVNAWLSTQSTNRSILLENLKDGTAALTLNNGSSSDGERISEFSGTVGGSGDIVFDWAKPAPGSTQVHKFSGDTASWSGRFINKACGAMAMEVRFTRAGSVFSSVFDGGGILNKNTGAGKMMVKFDSAGDIDFYGTVSKAEGASDMEIEVAQGKVTLHKQVTVDGATVDQGATAVVNNTLTANTVTNNGQIKLGEMATITTKQGSADAATMSKVQMSSTGISGTAQDGSSMSNADIEVLAQDASFTIADMTLTNTSITAASVNTQVSFDNVTVSGAVVLKNLKATMSDAQVAAGGSEGRLDTFKGSTTLLSGITMSAGSSLTVDLGDLSSYAAMGPGKYDLSITLSGFSMGEYTGNYAGSALQFAAGSWLSELLAQDNNANVQISITQADEGVAAASGAGSASTGVSYSTGNVGMVITITGLNVPEPTTSTLSLIALAALVARRRRK